MRIITVLFIIAAIAFSFTKKDAAKHAGLVNTIDSLPKFKVDNFPVKDEMLNCLPDLGACEKKYKGLVSIDKIWFRNDSLDQTLVFEMATDKFRAEIFLFNNKDIPTQLIKRIELHTGDRELATYRQKIKNFSGLLSFAKKIKPTYFKSKRGFALGDPKEKIIKVYGRPDHIKREAGFEEYEWDFAGDVVYDPKQKIKEKRIAIDNYGHQLFMYFKNDKLAGMILHNDIP